jgi:hypothetical protein
VKSVASITIFLNKYFRKKTLASTSARAYHSRRSNHQTVTPTTKTGSHTYGQFLPQEVNL